MPSFHYANFAGSLLHLMNCYCICRWMLPTHSAWTWHAVVTCPIFLCCIVTSSAHRNTAHRIETKVPKGFSLPEVKSVSSCQARTWENDWWCLLSYKQSQRLGDKQESLLPFLSYSSHQGRPLLPFLCRLSPLEPQNSPWSFELHLMLSCWSVSREEQRSWWRV